MSVRNTVKSIQDIMRQDSGVDGDAQRLSQLCWMFFLKIIDDQDKELYEQLLNDLQSAGNAGEYYTPRAVTAFMVDRIDPQPGKTLGVFKPYASIGTNLLFFEKGASTKEVWFYEHRVPAGQKAYSMTKPIRFEHLQPCIDWWGGAKRKGRQESEVAWKVSSEEIKARNYNLDCKNPHTVADDHGDPAELLAKLEQDEQRTAALRDQLKNILAEALLR